ncbi:MAG: sugar phosphate isomerase/epimerase [Desulfosarcina sp.]|nr:sugar phosphate isomerase/epimerase [Desulfobacterales bacterium]
MPFGAMNFPIRPVLEEIETFSALGFDYLELAMDPPAAHHAQLQAQRGAILDSLAQHQMGLVCHLPTFIHTADLTESIRRASREELLASIEVAAGLGARKAVIHPSYIGGMGRNVPELSQRYARESLRAALACADRLNIKLCLENLFPRLTPFGDVAHWEQLFAQYPQLGMTLDVGHAHIGPGGMNRILTYIQTFRSRIKHLHISDNLGRRDDHLPIGEGKIDFEAVVRALRQIGYAGGFTLEIFSDDRADLARSRDRLAAMLACLSVLTVNAHLI